VNYIIRLWALSVWHTVWVDLGIAIDSDIGLVSRTASGCFAILRQLRTIRRSVSVSMFMSLVVSLVMLGLDYGNATLAGLPVHLQSVLDVAARLIHSTSRYELVTPLLRDLHRRRVRIRPNSITLSSSRAGSWSATSSRAGQLDSVREFGLYRCLHHLAPP